MAGLLDIALNLPTIFKTKNMAEKESAKRFPKDELYNGAGDAYRHIVWQGLLANKLGEDKAKYIGNFHENENIPFVGAYNHPQNEINMDLKNNEIGRYIGKDAKNVQDILNRADIINKYKLYDKYKYDYPLY